MLRWLRGAFKSIGKILTVSLVITFPVGIIVTGGATVSDQATDVGNCIVTTEFSFMGMLAFHWSRFDQECAEAKAAFAISRIARQMNPSDQGVIATALAVYRKQYPRIDAAIKQVEDDLTEESRKGAVQR